MSSSLPRMNVPVAEPYEFPSFLQAGEPPKPLKYFYQAPELEIERRVDTLTISSRYTSSPGHLLLAPNEQECVYDAINVSKDKTWEIKILHIREFAFSVIKLPVSNTKSGSRILCCPGLKETPLHYWNYHLEFYYGCDAEKLAVEMKNRELKVAQHLKEQKENQKEGREFAAKKDREIAGELSHFYGKNTGDFDDVL